MFLPKKVIEDLEFGYEPKNNKINIWKLISTLSKEYARDSEISIFYAI